MTADSCAIARASLTRARRSAPQGMPNATFAEMVSLMRNTSWGTTPELVVPAALSSEIGRPPHSIDPPVGSRSPSTRSRRVLLPAPLEPTNATVWFCGITIETPLRTAASESGYVNSRSSMTMSPPRTSRSSGLLLVPARRTRVHCGAEHDAQPDPPVRIVAEIGGDPVQRRQRAQRRPPRTGPARSAHRRVSRWRTGYSEMPTMARMKPISSP